MEQSICNFLPTKNYTGSIKTVHFVYEADHHTLKQPFLKPIYHCYLITRGRGKMTMLDQEYNIDPGCIVWIFPGIPYYIDGDSSLRYLYISFTGPGAETLLQELEITAENPVYSGFLNIIDYWFAAISRMTQVNANILAESVLLYTLSFVSNEHNEETPAQNCNKVCSMIIDYIQNHFSDPDLSLSKIAEMFNYTQKYLSFLFKNVMGIGFNTYLNELRIKNAKAYIDQGVTSVTQLSTMCGYHEASYFSKVFKKITRISPIEYIKNSD